MQKLNFMIKNTFWFRHFLMCNMLAKRMCMTRGWQVKNFAACILKEESGVMANCQMTVFFWEADSFLCELHESGPGEVFENVEEDCGIVIEDLSKLSEEELFDYYEKYCIGKIDFNACKK